MFKGMRKVIRQNAFLRKFVGHTLPSTGIFDSIFINWKVDEFWRKRIDITLSDPENAKIQRCDDAGQIKNGKQLMHNGIWVNLGSYYGPEVSKLLLENRGVHEPQEEYLFQLVLDFLREKNTGSGVMIELGSFWAFYSLWFNKTFDKAKVIMIEPESYNIASGRRNFKLNGAEGTFVEAFVSDTHEFENSSGTRTVNVDGISKEFQLQAIDILHSDIQGFEAAMLDGAENILSNHLVEFIFISTHSNDLHYDCIKKLQTHNYRILCDIDLDDTYSEDGLILACSAASNFRFSGTIAKRSQSS